MRVAGRLGAALLACGALLIAACSAPNGAATAAASSPATPAPAVTAGFVAGQQYVTLPLPKGTATPTGPVELVEVFSYACPHCAEFAAYMDKLRTQLPTGVGVRFMPAVFNAAWMPSAQAFYAARQLGVVDKTHDAVFKAALEHYPLNSLSDYADFYAHEGVDRAAFLAAATNAVTTQQMAADQRTEIGWGIDATPTLVVGRLASDAKDAPFVGLMRSANIDSYAQLQQVGLWMAQQATRH